MHPNRLTFLTSGLIDTGSEMLSFVANRPANPEEELLSDACRPKIGSSCFRFEVACKKHSKMMGYLSKTGASRCPSFRQLLPVRVAQIIPTGTLLALCLNALSVPAQNRVSEYDVKAVYLYNFGQFIRFSPSEEVSKRQSFDICVVGEDPFGHTLDEVTANEKRDGKPVHVLRLKAAEEAHGCAIAYISASEGSRIGTDLDQLRAHEVLTVSDATDFLQYGGMIQFVDVGDHVRFAVNLKAVSSAQLSLSSDLLRVALSVNGKPPTVVQR